MNHKLAILGGDKVIERDFSSYPSIDSECIKGALSVLESGALSSFYGSWSKEFYGGKYINKLESLWSEYFNIAHSVTFNSATSGLYAAMGAINIQPGDEVIVPPFTMSATVMAPLIYGGIPIFVDIEPNTFTLDVEKVKRSITTRTKAILAVNLFGHPASIYELKKVAEEHDLWLVEDNAQAPTAKIQDTYSGTVGDIGIFSLNYHKHIHTGEGGICVTKSHDLAQRLQLIRNHGENVVEQIGIKNISGLVGFNYRMTEICAAIGIEQLKKIDLHVQKRIDLSQKIIEGLSGIEGIQLPVTRFDCTHVYYVLAIKIKESLGISRRKFVSALSAEGVPISSGYVKPLYHLPIFQKRKAFGDYPFNYSEYNYRECFCDVSERMHNSELICFEPCSYNLNDEDVKLILNAFDKVLSNREMLMEKSKCQE